MTSATATADPIRGVAPGGGCTTRGLRALIVEDSEADALLAVLELRRGGYGSVTHERVETREAMTAMLTEREWDVIISDYVMPTFSGMDALRLVRGLGLDTPFIIVSGKIGEDMAVEAMKAGANDYIMKGSLVRLNLAIERELREAEMRRERLDAEKALKDSRLALEEAYERQHYISEVLQRALAPIQPTLNNGYRAAAAYRPAHETDEIGGDFYDVFHTEDGKVGVLIGDISGKGIEVAALASSDRSTIKAFTYDSSSPGLALTRANAALYSDHGDDSFATALLAVLDPPTGRILYANAGHPSPEISRTAHEVECLSGTNLPIGVLEKVKYEEGESYLSPGDKMVLYTDGISESRHKAGLFGAARIKDTMRRHCGKSPDCLVGEILAAADRWSHGRRRDDATIVAIERCAIAG